MCFYDDKSGAVYWIYNKTQIDGDRNWSTCSWDRQGLKHDQSKPWFQQLIIRKAKQSYRSPIRPGVDYSPARQTVKPALWT